MTASTLSGVQLAVGEVADVRPGVRPVRLSRRAGVRERRQGTGV